MQPLSNKPGSYKNSGTFKLGPFITTAEFFRRRHIILRVKDSNGRHGTASISLKDAIDTEANHDFEAPITRRTFRRGTIQGTVVVKVCMRAARPSGHALPAFSVSYYSKEARPTRHTSCRLLRPFCCQVAGGQEKGLAIDDDSTDYEQMKDRGEIVDETDSDTEDQPAAAESEPEPEPESMEEGNQPPARLFCPAAAGFLGSFPGGFETRWLNRDRLGARCDRGGRAAGRSYRLSVLPWAPVYSFFTHIATRPATHSLPI